MCHLPLAMVIEIDSAADPATCPDMGDAGAVMVVKFLHGRRGTKDSISYHGFRQRPKIRLKFLIQGE